MAVMSSILVIFDNPDSSVLISHTLLEWWESMVFQLTLKIFSPSYTSWQSIKRIHIKLIIKGAEGKADLHLCNESMSFLYLKVFHVKFGWKRPDHNFGERRYFELGSRRFGRVSQHTSTHNQVDIIFLINITCLERETAVRTS
jgi:hypothetical protein